MSAAARAFVISLGRTPERLAGFRAANDGCGLAIAVSPAVDGSQVDPEEADAAHVRGVWRPGAIGNALSHRNLWRACAAGEEPFLVMEDDAVLRSDIAALLPRLAGHGGGDWDIVLLGYNTDSLLQVASFPGAELGMTFSAPYPSPEQIAAFRASRSHFGLHRLAHAFGSCAYLVSPEGARRLLDACFPLRGGRVDVAALGPGFGAGSLDAAMNRHYRTLRAFACFGPLALSPNDRAASTIEWEAPFAPEGAESAI